MAVEKHVLGFIESEYRRRPRRELADHLSVPTATSSPSIR